MKAEFCGVCSTRDGVDRVHPDPDRCVRLAALKTELREDMRVSGYTASREVLLQWLTKGASQMLGGCIGAAYSNARALKFRPSEFLDERAVAVLVLEIVGDVLAEMGECS